MMGRDCKTFLLYGYQYFWCFTQLQFGRFSMARLATVQMRPEKKSLFMIVARENFRFRGWYCWWKTSGTSWYDTVNMPFFLKGFIHATWLFGISSINVLVTTHDVSCLQECLDERVHRLSLNHHGFGASLGSTVEKTVKSESQWGTPTRTPTKMI